MKAIWYTLGSTGFTFLMTALGASVVFLFRKEINERFQNLFLGFAAGVMVAASVWSLLIPAMEQAEEAGGIVGCQQQEDFYWEDSFFFYWII